MNSESRIVGEFLSNSYTDTGYEICEMNMIDLDRIC